MRHFSTLPRFRLILERNGSVALHPQRDEHFSADQRDQRRSASERSCQCKERGGASIQKCNFRMGPASTLQPLEQMQAVGLEHGLACPQPA
jgi:hypothetical protein